MFEKELEQEEKTLAAERGRSPSDAASVFGGAAGAHPPAAAGPSPGVPPAAEALSTRRRARQFPAEPTADIR